ncbi:glycosyltransferase family 4 protein [Rhodospirillaceae bacterium RKSG073]|nr:glycosyltransferase family 4 protein [Curvivirga aplysinae]
MSYSFFSSIILCFLISWIATILIRRYLVHKAIMDHPNERSSHTVPTPRGGGIVVTGMTLLTWCWFAYESQNWLAFVPAIASLGLAIISWLDDLIDLSAGRRLLLQLIAVFIGYYWIAETGSVTQGLLPIWAEWVIFSFFWAGFVNFYNFMDGIDGISGVETIAISLGLFLIASQLGVLSEIYIVSIYIAAIALGFLMVNWHPAKIFLGDVGSIPLGYLLGALLLHLAAKGYWVSALILPAYYLCDAGLTLTKRLLKKEKIWHAHKQHFYQQATQKGFSHAKVSLAIACVNILLVGAAYYAIFEPLHSFIFAAIVVASLLLWMRKK